MKLKPGHERATETPKIRTLTLCKRDGSKLFGWLVFLGIHHVLSWDNDGNTTFEVKNTTKGG